MLTCQGFDLIMLFGFIAASVWAYFKIQRLRNSIQMMKDGRFFEDGKVWKLVERKEFNS